MKEFLDCHIADFYSNFGKVVGCDEVHIQSSYVFLACKYTKNQTTPQVFFYYVAKISKNNDLT